MTIVVDRRLNPSGKNHTNRQKFLERSRGRIKEAVKKSVSDKTIKDIGKDEKVKVRSKDIREPSFSNDPKSGRNKGILPGNKEYSEGDTIPKPQNGEGSGGNKAGKGDSLDDFEFTLTREEFLDYLFDDLELPDFVKESIKVTDNFKFSRAGFTSSGSPANLSIIRTFKNSIGRRMALSRPSDEEVAEAETLWMNGVEQELPTKELDKLYEEWQALKARQKVVPYIDDNDLRYRYYESKPNPSSQAVMFCLMDVSGSMGEKEKDIAKRFFLLLYLFLEKKYDKIDIRFIRHTEVADEVDEHTFFYDTKSGGTQISSGLDLISDIIKKEYKPADWNIYISQVTDGDNFGNDNNVCRDIITKQLQPIVQYFAYIQIDRYTKSELAAWAGLFPYSSFEGAAWPLYEELSETFENIEARKIQEQWQLWTVFASLFKQKA